MERKVYVIVWQTKGFQDLSVFTSLSAAEECFDKIMRRFGLQESKMTYFTRQAFCEKTDLHEKGSLTLLTKLQNRNFI